MVFKKALWNVIKMTLAINENLTAFCDYFLPRFCVSCSKKLDINEKVICNKCLTNISRATEDRISFEYQKKFNKDKIISDFFSMFIFEKDRELQNAIHELKYQNKFKVGIFLGELLAIELKICRPDWQFDIILPIPLHQLKKAERGYNQSYYISLGIKHILDKKVNTKSVKRTKYTQSQTKMNLIERKENISGAFQVKRKKMIEGKNILLIDDVITTGATITECGKILLDSGANKIYAASIAIAD